MTAPSSDLPPRQPGPVRHEHFGRKDGSYLNVVVPRGRNPDRHVAGRLGVIVSFGIVALALIMSACAGPV